MWCGRSIRTRWLPPSHNRPGFTFLKGLRSEQGRLAPRGGPHGGGISQVSPPGGGCRRDTAKAGMAATARRPDQAPPGSVAGGWQHGAARRARWRRKEAASARKHKPTSSPTFRTKQEGGCPNMTCHRQLDTPTNHLGSINTGP